MTTTTTTTTTSGVDEAAGPCAECVRLKRENVRLTWELGEREGLCRALVSAILTVVCWCRHDKERRSGVEREIQCDSLLIE